MLLVNKDMKNNQLMKVPEIVEALQGGKTIIIDKVPTSNTDYVSVYFFGMAETTSSNNLGKAQNQWLDFSESSKFPMRAMQNAAIKVADQFQIGTSFDQFAIQIVDTTTKSYDSQKQRQSESGELYFDEHGNPIYRTGRLVTTDELEAEGHQVIKRVQNKAVGSVKAAELLATV